MKKRILGVLLCVALLAGVLPVGSISVSADEMKTVYATNYDELKAALEADEDTHIIVDQFMNTKGLSYYSMRANVDYVPFSGSLDSQNIWTVGAINIPLNRHKHLTVNTTIDCRAVELEKELYCFIQNAGFLTIDGHGTIAIGFNTGGNINAIIFNRNELNVSGNVTLDATQILMKTFGVAIFNFTGTTNISGGNFIGYLDVAGGSRDASTGAVIFHHSYGTTYSQYGNISGGTFSTKGDGTNRYGLLLDHTQNINLTGGTFEGIYTNPGFTTGEVLYLSDALGENCIYLCEGEEFDGSAVGDTKKRLTVLDKSKLISRITLNGVAPPVAGQHPNKNFSFSADSHCFFSKKGDASNTYFWYNETDDHFVDASEIFDDQKKYSVRMYIEADEGYSFAAVSSLELAGVDVPDSAVTFEATALASVVIAKIDFASVGKAKYIHKLDFEFDIPNDGEEYPAEKVGIERVTKAPEGVKVVGVETVQFSKAITGKAVANDLVTFGIIYEILPGYELASGAVATINGKEALKVLTPGGVRKVAFKDGVRITTNPTIRITKDLPQTIEYTKGETISLSIAATGKNMTYQWQIGVPSTGRKPTVYTDFGTNKNTATYTPSESDDGKVIRCKITNADGNAYTTVAYLKLVEKHSALKGDINGDGKVNAMDCLLLKGYILKTFKNATAEQIERMNVNGDKTINAVDYALLRAAVLGTKVL